MREQSIIAVVFGTYNRIEHLKAAVASLREHAGCPADLIIVDGGSTDGSRAWLAEQEDVTLIGQRGPLTGAVSAFNLGFGYAVDHGYPYVFHFNDDAELASPAALARAVEALDAQPDVGAVCFAVDLRGEYAFENAHGLIYPNFGMIRREAGMDVARAQGDPTGRAWWNPIYRTYAADTELGMWMHRLGWLVVGDEELRVHDCKCEDALREDNRGDDPDRPDSRLFWSRWPDTRTVLEPVSW